MDFCTSVNELSSIGVQLFPNPVLNTLTIQSDNTEIIGSKWTLLDYQGRILNDGKLETNQSLSFESLPAGFYYLKVDNNGSIYSNEIIKQ
jgi:hypothetical protein